LSDSDNNDDWNFEVKAPKKDRKKDAVKPLLKKSPSKKKKLTVEESGQAQRKSRRQMARDAGGTSMGGRDIVDAASHGKRMLAFVIDLIVIALCIVVGQFITVFFPGMGKSIEEFLGPEIIASIPVNVGGLCFAFLIHLIGVTVPTASTQKSLGKKLMKIKIIGVLKPKPPLGVVFIREYIAKPISILSVIGIMIIFLNRKHRGLHDFIAGTYLLDS
jgi:uncharacterized RDD family membrane protein YckC